MSGFVSSCYQCGQSDDHPKVIAADLQGESATFHHDCLPAGLVAQLSEDGKRIVKECVDGLRGDELRARIHELHPQATSGSGPQDAR